MNNLDKQYLDLLEDIMTNGVKKQDRTGTGTISVFGRQIRHNMKEGFPILTTKKMAWKSIVVELLWFLKGDTNIKYLVDNGCNIWNGDAHKKYVDVCSANDSKYNKWMRDNGDGTLSLYSMKEFVQKIKTDDEFAGKWGELGPIYGAQWRDWGGHTVMSHEEEYRKWFDPNGDGLGTYKAGPKKIDGVDQIKNLIETLKTNPDSRRLMVNAWNVGELENMTLPPCHYGFQVYTRDLTFEERCEYAIKEGWMHPMGAVDYPETHYALEKSNVPTKAISLMWNQRSVDTFLGLPFNISSYGLLLTIIAKEVNMVPDQLIGNLGDTHLYSNHIEPAKKQMGCGVNKLPSDIDEEAFATILKNSGHVGVRLYAYLDMYDRYNNAVKLKVKSIKEQQYESAAKYRDVEKEMENKLLEAIGTYTLKSFPLPSLDKLPSYKCIKPNFECYEPDDFKLIGYQSHPPIKAPLSN